MFETINIRDVKLLIGSLAKLLRKREGLTQGQLAEKLSMSRITIQNLESGKNATMDTLFKVLQHAGMLDSFHSYIANEITNNSHESLY